MPSNFPIFGRRRRAEVALHGASFEGSSSEEEPEEVDVHVRLAFERIGTRKSNKISVRELAAALERLGVTSARDVAQQIVWETDEDMDGQIGWEEFVYSYQRAAGDETGKEPRKLFNIIEFLMADADGNGTLTFAEALQCYGKRYGQETIQKLLASLFTPEERSGVDVHLSFAEYCKRDQAIIAARNSNIQARLNPGRRSRPYVKRAPLSIQERSVHTSMGFATKSSCAHDTRDFPLYPTHFRARRNQ